MKIQKNNRLKRRLILCTAIAVVLLTAYLIPAKLFSLPPFSIVKDSVKILDSSEAQKSKQPDEKQSITSQGSQIDKTTDEIPVSESLTPEITELSQNDSEIIFAGKVLNAKSAGRCVISFSSPNDRPIVKEADATLKTPGESICGPLSISELEFSYLGEWSVEFAYYENGSRVSTKSSIRIN